MAVKEKTPLTKEQKGERTRQRLGIALSKFNSTDLPEKLIEFLKENDKRFYGESASFKMAKNKFCQDVPQNVLVHYVSNYCKYWKCPDNPRAKRTSSTDLSSKQWERIIGKCSDLVFREPDATLEFCIKWLSAQSQVGLNKSLLMNCSAFHRVTNNRFRQEKD